VSLLWKMTEVQWIMTPGEKEEGEEVRRRTDRWGGGPRGNDSCPHAAGDKTERALQMNALWWRVDSGVHCMHMYMPILYVACHNTCPRLSENKGASRLDDEHARVRLVVLLHLSARTRTRTYTDITCMNACLRNHNSACIALSLYVRFVNVISMGPH
jgi:hypothetical protein